MATVRETERKYEVVDGVELPGWAGLAGVESLVGPEEQTLEAVYFDTEDLRLAQAGVTLRRRRGGDDAGWHLKLPVGGDGHGDSRDEVRVSDARAGRRRKPPAELVALTRVFTRGAALAPVAELATTRRRWRLTDADGRLLIEVVDDHVAAHTLGASTSGESWREVEVELGTDGDPGLLDNVERRLLDAGIRRSDAQSKLARLLGDRLPPPTPAPRLGRKSTVGDVVLAYLREQSDAIARQDPAVRQDAPGAVHQMRVATRRMRSALQAYGKIIDRAATRELTDELKWLAGVLGDARDLEVLRARFTDSVEKLPDELVVGPVQARLTRYFAGRETDARTALIAALDSDRYLALLAAVDRLLASPPLTRRARGRARRELPVGDRPDLPPRRRPRPRGRPAAERARPRRGAARGAQGGQATALRHRSRRTGAGRIGRAADQGDQERPGTPRQPPGRRGGPAGAA